MNNMLPQEPVENNEQSLDMLRSRAQNISENILFLLGHTDVPYPHIAPIRIELDENIYYCFARDNRLFILPLKTVLGEARDFGIITTEEQKIPDADSQVNFTKGNQNHEFADRMLQKFYNNIPEDLNIMILKKIDFLYDKLKIKPNFTYDGLLSSELQEQIKQNTLPTRISNARGLGFPSVYSKEQPNNNKTPKDS